MNLPDDFELRTWCDCLKDRGLDDVAALFTGLVAAERSRCEDRRLDAGRTVDEWIRVTRGEMGLGFSGPLLDALREWALDPAPKLDGLLIEATDCFGDGSTILKMSVRRWGAISTFGRPIDGFLGHSNEPAYLRHCIESCHLGLIEELRKQPRGTTVSGRDGVITFDGFSTPLSV